MRQTPSTAPLLTLPLLLLGLGCDGSTAAKPAGGPPAADFSLKDLEGNTVTLSGLRGKGVILNFWFLA